MEKTYSISNKQLKSIETSQKSVLSNKTQPQKQKVYMGLVNSYVSSAGQRARVPPDPIPNSEVKPCSVSSCSVVLGHVNLGKLATFLFIPILTLYFIA